MQGATCELLKRMLPVVMTVPGSVRTCTSGTSLGPYFRRGPSSRLAAPQHTAPHRCSTADRGIHTLLAASFNRGVLPRALPDRPHGGSYRLSGIPAFNLEHSDAASTRHWSSNTPVTPVESDGEKLIKSASTSEERLIKTREALENGTLGFGFSAGGFLYPYHLGVLWQLRDLKILKDYTIKMAGSSAGSLAIATYACGLDVEKATGALFEFAANCRAHGTRYRLGGLLKDFLHAYLPDNAHELCSGTIHVHITRVFPVFQPEVISEFKSKDDLVNALLTSCHIPFYFNGHWMTSFRNRYYMDGGVASFIPRPPTERVVKVCCFPVNEVLSTVQGKVGQWERIANLLDVSISPDAYEPWPYDYQTMLTWALVPADDELLKTFIAKGRKDAHIWANRMRLIPAEDSGEKSQAEPATESKLVI